MKKSICFDYKYTSTCEERLRRIEAAGFTGIYLHSQYNPAEHIDLVLRSSLEIESLHLPYKRLEHGRSVDARYVNVIWTAGDEGNRYVAQLIHEVEFAHRCGIGIVVMHVTGGDAPPAMSDSGVRNIATVLEACERSNIVLCLENLRRLDYLDFIFARLTSPNLKLCFDSGHANYMTRNVADFPWERYGDKLHYLHLNDNDGQSDQHLIPFRGNIEWEKLMRVLYELNPNMALTLEVRGSQSIREQHTEEEYLQMCFSSLTGLERLAKG